MMSKLNKALFAITLIVSAISSTANAGEIIIRGGRGGYHHGPELVVRGHFGGYWVNRPYYREYIYRRNECFARAEVGVPCRWAYANGTYAEFVILGAPFVWVGHGPRATCVTYRETDVNEFGDPEVDTQTMCREDDGYEWVVGAPVAVDPAPVRWTCFWTGPAGRRHFENSGFDRELVRDRTVRECLENGRAECEIRTSCERF